MSVVGSLPEVLEPPPKIEGRGPTLATMNEVERILREAEGSLSLNEIKRRMSAKAVRHRTVRQIIDEFCRLGLAVEGSKGVVWTLNPSRKLWTRGRAARL